MKYKVNDLVRIKSLDWYNKNKNKTGDVPCGEYDFVSDMSVFCGKILTIDVDFGNKTYLMKEDNNGFIFTDEMIEGLMEEENKLKFKVGDEVRIKGTDIGGTIESVIRGQLIVNSKGSKIPAWPEDVVLMKSVEEETKPNIIEEAKTYWDSIKDAWICPEGYIFKDENGNEILTSKIILEKKKKEVTYPKTYEECCKILGFLNVDLCFNADYRNFDASKEQWKRLGLMNQFYQLLICRDAYWKIAGEEMGLGKPWKSDWNTSEPKYVIAYTSRGIEKQWETTYCKGFAFPTEEMRDAFYENFKELIESVKELL